MAISTATYILIGSGSADETVTKASIANNANSTPAVVDLLGDDTSTGDAELYLLLTSTVTAGTFDFKFNNARRSNGGTQEYAKASYELSVAPTNGTQMIPLGRRPIGRFLSVDCKNNATGATGTVGLLAKVTKYS